MFVFMLQRQREAAENLQNKTGDDDEKEPEEEMWVMDNVQYYLFGLEQHYIN